VVAVWFQFLVLREIAEKWGGIGSARSWCVQNLCGENCIRRLFFRTM